MIVTLSGTATNLAIAAGETVAESLTIAAAGIALNLTGYTLKMQINFPSLPLLLTTTNGGIAITNATQGIVQINVADTVSDRLAVGTFPYDFWMISGGGIATRLLYGSFTIIQNITPIP